MAKGLNNSLCYLHHILSEMFFVFFLLVLMYFGFTAFGVLNYLRYNALDALRLISFEDEDFHCERCNGKLEVESDKLAAQDGGDGGDGDENARRRRREKLKDMLQKMEVLYELLFCLFLFAALYVGSFYLNLLLLMIITIVVCWNWEVS